MTGAVDDFEFNRGFHAAVGAVQFVRLINRHLRILVSMQKKERRIKSIHMKDRAGKTSQFDNVRRLTTQQQLQCGNTDLQSVRR